MPTIDRTIYFGVDPGKGGATVCLAGGKVYSCSHDVTEHDLWNWLDTKVEMDGEAFAVIEKVHAMPGQGVTSMFTFGQSFGFLRGLLTAVEVPFEEVHPRSWQKALGIPKRDKNESKTQFKNRLKTRAQQLYPKEKVTLKTADALLLATYCQRKHEGKLG